MSDHDDIIEVTAAVEFQIVDDRLHFTVVSGNRRHPFSISFHKARAAASRVEAMLNARDREDRVMRLEARRS